MAHDSAILCCTSATSDINTARRRFEHEGQSFLTIVLPELGKSTQKWIDQGQVGINSSFKTGRGRLPLFLGGYFSRVFDRKSGALLDDPCIESILAIRQLTLSFAKISLPSHPRRARRAIQGFIECEQDIRQFDAELSEKDIAAFRRVSNLLFREVFTKMDRDVYFGKLLPQHGPGAVADNLTSNGKYRNTTWTSRLDRVFPLDKYLLPNHHFVDGLEHVNILEPGSEIPVKVITVPKTMKTPRIIAIEPAHMQYMQQALLRSFLEGYRRDELLRGLIGFDDQVPNQDLARQGSADGRTATLDLSEASDRVSNQLVRAMTHRWPHLTEAIDACRSRRADVPGHGVIRLSKFASMGSALCFPIEAMVFTTMIFLGIEESLNVTLTKKHIASFLGSVRVYGDDLIVPVDHVQTIVSKLEHFGAKVGTDKSFWTGKFRESCGKEYFNGVDISIVRVRQELPCTMADVTGVISTVSLRNQLYNGWYPETVRWLDKLLGKILKYYPTVAPASPVLGKVSRLRNYDCERMSPHLHSPQVRGYVLEAKPPSDPLEDVGALLKCLLKLETRSWSADLDISSFSFNGSGVEQNCRSFVPSSWMPSGSQDEKHLERSGRPKRVSIRLGWWSAF
jgi:hypothetical protein